MSRVAYFMDDELLRPTTWAGLPKPYAKKLRAYCLARAGDIRGLATDYWFSTRALQRSHGHLPSEVLPPRPLAQDRAAPRIWRASHTSEAPLLVFYHGSAAHQAEIAWLRPVMAEVLARCPNVHFEIIGDHEVNKRFRGLPRTRVVHPMGWPSYLNHCRTLAGHIGLAPLLDTPFNAGRAHVKAFDISRCGAMGVYSAQGPYGQVIRDGENGLLLDNLPELWVEAITSLVNDTPRLDTLRRAAMALLG
ncbi:MAG TPA: hypothetical protein VGC69_07210 [Bordetella sp.]